MKTILFMGNQVECHDCAEVSHAFINGVGLEASMLVVNNPLDLNADMVASGLFHILGRRATSAEILACLPPQPAPQM